VAPSNAIDPRALASPYERGRAAGSFILGDAVLAYLDPGTGSMIVQLLVGGVAAVGVAVKLYWHRILRLLRIRKTEPEPDREP
jgi:hypothetical protein